MMSFNPFGYSKKESWQGERLSTITGNLQKQTEIQYSPSTQETFTTTETYAPTETYNPVMTYAPAWNIQYQSAGAEMTSKKTYQNMPSQKGTDVSPIVAPSLTSTPSQAQSAEAKSSGGLFGSAMPILVIAGLGVAALFLIKR